MIQSIVVEVIISKAKNITKTAKEAAFIPLEHLVERKIKKKIFTSSGRSTKTFMLGQKKIKIERRTHLKYFPVESFSQCIF